MKETILILDFGSQYTQLIARRVRELNVYCEIHPFSAIDKLSGDYKGLILSGSPFSVNGVDAPQPDLGKFFGSIPILGICYGAQLLAFQHGGKVMQANTREYGRANLSFVDANSPLLHGIEAPSQVWMSHGDTIVNPPVAATIIASTKDVAITGFQFKDLPVFGIQFHPEVFHSDKGMVLLKNFLVDVCQCQCDWTSDSFIDTTIAQLKAMVGDERVVMALSGGVDSTVAAMLLHKAIGKQLFCIFVDNGLLRKDEFSLVLTSYKDMGLNVKGVDAKQRFFDELKGVSDPEMKRKIIGRLFIEVFDAEAKQIQGVKWLGQGTIYPDIIESVSVKGPSATIKSHHNVGGLPKEMQLRVVEPLNALFKDEVRRVGKALHIPVTILQRHPFPGPGLAIRIIGEVTAEKVKVLQEVDHIFIEGLKRENLYDKVWQAGAIFLPIQSVGVMGDERTYENAVALRAVSSTDGMTADFCHLDFEFLGRISNEIINSTRGINRVVYDISSKPPATIEWE